MGAADRSVSFGLSALDEGYRLDVTEASSVGGQAINVEITKNGERLRGVESEYVRVFAIGEGLGYFSHQTRGSLSGWMNVDDTGPARVVVSFVDDGRQIVLGTDVDVTERSDFEGGIANPTQTDFVHASGVMVERDGWTFDVTGLWPQSPQFGWGAALTLVRENDLALSFESLDQVGDGEYRFDPAVAGPGDYLAVLELASAPTFSFLVSLDENGGFVERAESAAIESVEAFVDAVDAFDADRVLALLSARCASVLSSVDPQELLRRVDPELRYWTTSVVADVSDREATITYEVIEGDYTPGTTPFWRSRTEQWVAEAGEWRRDECLRGSLEWP